MTKAIGIILTPIFPTALQADRSGGATAGGTSRPASSSDYDAKDGYFPSYPSYPINTEEYAYNPENGYRSPVTSPLSTFSLDVDTASYSNVRQKLLRGQLPEKGVVRTEEMVNYFDYDFPVPKDSERFSVYTEVERPAPGMKTTILQ